MLKMPDRPKMLNLEIVCQQSGIQIPKRIRILKGIQILKRIRILKGIQIFFGIQISDQNPKRS